MNATQRALHEQLPLEHIFKATRSKKYRASTTWLIDNMQTRYLAGWNNFFLPSSSKLLLDRAKKNLENRYIAFGIKEHYNESLNFLAKQLRFQKGGLIQSEKKKTHITKRVSEKDLEAIRANNLLDLELYSFALELFKHNIQIHPQDEE